MSAGYPAGERQWGEGTIFNLPMCRNKSRDLWIAQLIFFILCLSFCSIIQAALQDSGLHPVRVYSSTRHPRLRLTPSAEASQMAKEYEKRGGDYEVGIRLLCIRPSTLLRKLLPFHLRLPAVSMRKSPLLSKGAVFPPLSIRSPSFRSTCACWLKAKARH